MKRKYSDGLLKMLIERGADPRQDHALHAVEEVSQENVDRALMERLDEAARAMERAERAKALAEEERMRKAGLCP